MGAGFSDLVGYNWSRGRDPPARPGLGDMPESCVSSILMHLDPPEICKLAGLNRTFYGASSGDYLWETKLPQNYEFLVSKVLGGRAMSKKEIYARLCRPNRFDGGTKDVWLDKSSGKVWLSVSAKAMKITGIDDRRYWNYIPTEESRFHMVAYLQQIWWFEVVGEIEVQLPPGSYTLYFRLHLGKPLRRFGRIACNLDHVHGWDMKPVRFQLFTSDGQHCSSERHLDLPGKWVYYDVGDFLISNNNNSSTNVSSPTKIKFSMMQIDCTHIKGGLCVDSTLICPSDSRERLIRLV